MSAGSQDILMIAGEISGDLHGSSLISELKGLNPNIHIHGIGGEKMKEAGMDLIYHLNKMAFLGFTEVIKHIPFIKKVQKEIVQFAKNNNIKLAVLIDYPGFNLSLAKKLKSLGVYIVYYISPQIWAWGAGRINKIRVLIDKMIVFFPFEKELYRNNDIKTEFVGHPLVERIEKYNFLSRDEFYNKFKLDKSKGILLLLAGSRKHEVELIFPNAVKAAVNAAKEFNLQVVTACSENISEKYFREISDEKDFKIIKDHNYDLMNLAKIGIIKSGTSTLEAGLFKLPMVIVYRTSRLTYLISKSLIKLDRIGLVNIVLNDKAVTELIQDEASSEKIYNECRRILSDNVLYDSIKRKLSGLKEILGSTGASRRAAVIINSALNEL